MADDPVALLQQAVEHAPKVLPAPLADLVQRDMRNGLWWLGQTPEGWIASHVDEINELYANKAREVLALPVPAEPPADLVETVALAMVATTGHDWQLLLPESRARFRGYARAAITAIQQHGGGPLAEVAAERQRQDTKWGPQNHPDGTGDYPEVMEAHAAQDACQAAAEGGYLTWAHVLREEVCEALAESDPVRLRAELVQVAAVAVCWAQAIDRREVK